MAAIVAMLDEWQHWSSKGIFLTTWELAVSEVIIVRSWLQNSDEERMGLVQS
jgi:hypothetical protein